MELNPPQRDAASSIQGPLVLLAGAGTGKTRVITYRIANLLHNRIAPEAIVAVTFTNKAAREMRERVSALVGSRAKSLFIGTFHSYCLNILRRFHRQAGLPPRFSIIAASDQVDLVQRCLDERGWASRLRAYDVHARISRAKNMLVSPEDLANGTGQLHDEDPSTLSELYAMYQRQLQLNHAIDFDDCIYRAVQLLRSESDVRETLHQEVSHILVDEYQDTNLAQLELLRLVTGPKNNICVVGDDDQSIYSWRGALAQNIDRFEELFPGSRLIRLEQNYRCTTLILDAANQVIRNNPKRKEKTLWSKNDSSDLITVVDFDEEVDEARWIARRCLAYQGKGYKASDIGILYRSNAQAKALEVAMLEHRLRYRVFGGQSFFERVEIKDFLSYLRVIDDPSDLMAFWRIVNTPSRGLGLKSLEKLAAAAAAAKSTPFAALSSSAHEMPGKARATCQGFVLDIQRMQLKKISAPSDLADLARDIIKSFRLEEHYRQKSATAQAASAKVDSLRRIPNWLQDIGSQIVDDGKKLSLSAVIDTLSLNDAPTKEEKDLGDTISLMTIHAAKGLEFSCVFLAGAEEGNIPHRNSLLDDRGVEEERRLFYVALTRAKAHMNISYCRERRSGPAAEPREPSRFISEMPDSILNRNDAAVELRRDVEAAKEQTLNKLGQLRTMIRKGFEQNP